MILKKPSSNLRVRTPWIEYGQTGGIKPPSWMTPYADFNLEAEYAKVSPGILEVSAPSDRLGDFTVVRGSSATYVDSDGIIKEAFGVGDELVTNGDFEDGSTDWILQDNWTVSGGELHASDVAPYSLASQNLIFTEGKSYSVTYTITDFQLGSVRAITAGGTVWVGQTRTSEGTYTEIFTAADGNTLFRFSAVGLGFTGSIDNVSVKEVSYDIARIDYTNGVAELLTEPQSTNLITYSEDFSDASWVKRRVTTLPNDTISPTGELNADKIVATTDSNTHRIDLVVTLVDNDVYSYSVFAKKGGYSGISLEIGSAGIGGVYSAFDLENGISEDFSGSTSKITALADGWYLCTVTSPSNTIDQVVLGINDTFNNQTYVGDGTSGIYVFGADLEALPYATSYIPTNGSTVTRLQDQITDGANVNVINSEEGVLFFEGSALFDDGTFRQINISDKTSQNFIAFYYRSTSNSITVAMTSNGAAQMTTTQNIGDTTLNTKVAIKWKVNDFALWVNGVEVFTDNIINVPNVNVFYNLEFARYNDTEYFFGRTRALKVYDRALTDEELEQITKQDVINPAL